MDQPINRINQPINQYSNQVWQREYIRTQEDGDTGPIEEFLSEAVKGNCEGLMVKTLTVSTPFKLVDSTMWLACRARDRAYLNPNLGCRDEG